MEHLFQVTSVFDYKRDMIDRAHQEVTALNDGAFTNSTALLLRIAEIKRKILIAVPQLSFAERKGKRVKRGNQDYIDVSIPFSGSRLGFSLSPSTKTLGARGTVLSDTLILSLPDNEHLEQELQAQVDVINHNLGNLATDLATLAEEINGAIENAKQRRLEQIKRKADLDSKRSFPID